MSGDGANEYGVTREDVAGLRAGMVVTVKHDYAVAGGDVTSTLPLMEEPSGVLYVRIDGLPYLLDRLVVRYDDGTPGRFVRSVTVKDKTPKDDQPEPEPSRRPLTREDVAHLKAGDQFIGVFVRRGLEQHVECELRESDGMLLTPLGNVIRTFIGEPGIHLVEVVEPRPPMPDGQVLLDPSGRVWQRINGAWSQAGDNWRTWDMDVAGWRVLWTPGEDA